MTQNLIRRAAPAFRAAALLMVIALGGCDNVDWGGIDLAVVPPPPKAAATEAELQAADRLPDGPILYYVRRDSAGVEVVPVGEVTDEGLASIPIGEDPGTFGTRFISAFMREGAELTLFRNGRRAGTLIVDSAYVPTADVCRRLPRATGTVELSGSVGEATEFLAMARTQAPQGRMLIGGPLEPDRRMLTLGDIMAEQALRRRGAQLPNWNRARAQIQPFPLTESQDRGFTASYLVDDALEVGFDDVGYSLFIVAVPQAQVGYDSVHVQFTNYPSSGKAARRTVDFLDWDRDGDVELLIEVYGTRNRWFEAVGKDENTWSRTFEDRCDAPPAAPAVAADTAAADTVAGSPAPPRQNRPAPTRRNVPDTAAATPTQAGIPTPRSVPDLVPQIRLSIPGVTPQQPRRDTTPPDTTGLRTS